MNAENQTKAIALNEKTMDKGLAAFTYEDLWQFSSRLAETQFVPKDFFKKPGDVMAAILFGHELGIKPIAALQGIAVINGRPSLWGDLMMAVVQAHPAYEWHKEHWDETRKCATFYLKRKGVPEAMVCKWDQADTERAGFKTKDTYARFPQRMHRHRARDHACRNLFADALKGMISRELADDESIDITPSELKPQGDSFALNKSTAIDAELFEPKLSATDEMLQRMEAANESASQT